MLVCIIYHNKYENFFFFFFLTQLWIHVHFQTWQLLTILQVIRHSCFQTRACVRFSEAIKLDDGWNVFSIHMSWYFFSCLSFFPTHFFLFFPPHYYFLIAFLIYSHMFFSDLLVILSMYYIVKFSQDEVTLLS